MSEISEWVGQIHVGIWQGLQRSSLEVMNVWTSEMVAKMRSGGNTYPSGDIIGKRSQRLANALRGFSEHTDIQNLSPNSIIHERTVLVPYADISEHGAKIAPTDKQRRAMFARLKLMNMYKKEYSRIGQGVKGIFDHKAFGFVKNSAKDFTTESLSKAIMPYIEAELNKIRNIEVVIGNS